MSVPALPVSWVLAEIYLRVCVTPEEYAPLNYVEYVAITRSPSCIFVLVVRRKTV